MSADIEKGRALIHQIAKKIKEISDHPQYKSFFRLKKSNLVNNKKFKTITNSLNQIENQLLFYFFESCSNSESKVPHLLKKVCSYHLDQAKNKMTRK